MIPGTRMPIFCSQRRIFFFFVYIWKKQMSTIYEHSDNDFMTTDGSMIGQPYDAGIDVHNQFLVFGLTLPNASDRGV